LDAMAKEVGEGVSASQARLAELQTPVKTVSDPRAASVEVVLQLLKLDLNKPFSTAENLEEPGVRLRSLSLDAASDSLKLEYELDSVVKATAVTEALNAGYETRPWRLESVSASDSQFRGVWSVRMRDL
jgi:hypothetical protein